MSTQRQSVSGLGLEAQRELVEGHTRSTAGVLLREYVEVESGARRQRPILAEAVKACREQHATLLIAKLDRLARNVAFISSLMESRVDFVAVDAPYANKLMLHILAAFAEHEREQISERTKSALAMAKARGVELGKNGKLLAVHNKATAIEAAESLRQPILDALRAGSTTLQGIADCLNANGHLTRNGAYWQPTTISRAISRLNLKIYKDK